MTSVFEKNCPAFRVLCQQAIASEPAEEEVMVRVRVRGRSECLRNATVESMFHMARAGTIPVD